MLSNTTDTTDLSLGINFRLVLQTERKSVVWQLLVDQLVDIWTMDGHWKSPDYAPMGARMPALCYTQRHGELHGLWDTKE